MYGTTQQYLYARAYQLTLGPQAGGQGLQYGNIAGTTSALRISFNIDKPAVGCPNKGTVTLYNLSQSNRTALVQGYRLTLDAGYQGMVERVLFGKVWKVTTKREGPDIATTLEVIDGLESLMYAVLDRPYPPGTTLAQVLADVAKAMQALPGVVLGLPAKTFPRGLTVHGLCRDTLRRLLQPLGLEASLSNGRLNILPKHAHLGSAAIVLSPRTGLLGVPNVSFTSTDFTALLNPKLVPGQLVQLVTANTNTSGFFKIRSAKLQGDTHAGNWQVSCQGVQLANALQDLKPARGFEYGQAVVPGLV